MNNIGPPLSNTSGFVLHPDSDKLVLAGGFGELCFGGDQVGRGYVNQPELTAESFMNHPIYGRIYRSGDLGRLLPDGSFLIHGRANDQVKLRGLRIELGEISSVLAESPLVEDSAAIVTENQPQMIVAFWVPRNSNFGEFSTLPVEPTSSALTALFETMSSRLPDYMIPTHVVPVSCIPLTSQGKTDKRKLLSAYKSLSREVLEQVARGFGGVVDHSDSMTEQETAVAAAISDTLRIPQSEVARHTSFFGLGLDSIIAISFVKTLKQRTGYRTSVAEILKNPTVARLARSLQDTPTQSMNPVTSIKSVFHENIISSIRKRFSKDGESIQCIYPCTPLQESMLSSGGLGAEAAYINWTVLEIHSDPAKLQQCWSLMCKRHEILRACFIPTDDPEYAFAQVILEDYAPPWSVIDLPSESEDSSCFSNFAHSAVAEAVEKCQPPFALARFVSPERSYLVFACHHCVYDGFAIERLLKEVEMAYQGLELSPPVKYEPFLEHMLATRHTVAETFWAQSLQGLKIASFSSRSVNPHTNTNHRGNGSSVQKTLEVSLSSLESRSKVLSVSLLAVLQASWARTLSLLVGQTDICFGNVVSGRSAPIDKLEELIAPCFNTVPVRIDLRRERTNFDAITTLNEFNSKSVPYQLYPLRKIQSRLGHGGMRLFNSLFLLQQGPYLLDSDIWELKGDFGDMDVSISHNLRNASLI